MNGKLCSFFHIYIILVLLHLMSRSCHHSCYNIYKSVLNYLLSFDHGFKLYAASLPRRLYRADFGLVLVHYKMFIGFLHEQCETKSNPKRPTSITFDQKWHYQWSLITFNGVKLGYVIYMRCIDHSGAKTGMFQENYVIDARSPDNQQPWYGLCWIMGLCFPWGWITTTISMSRHDTIYIY